MASIRIKFRPSSKEEREGVIYYQVLHRRLPRQIATEYRIRTNEWDETRSAVVVCDKEREAYILSVREHIRWDISRLQRIIRKRNDGIMDFTSDDIVEDFRRFSKEYSFVGYMETAIARLRLNGREGTAQNYHSALNSFRNFMASVFSEDPQFKEEDLMLDGITSHLMERYESWHRQQGHVPNTISFYMRIFRAVYKRAVEDNVIEDARPFRRVYTGIEKTEKRALPLNTMRKVKQLDLSLKPKLDFARDIFLLSFYLRGMSFIDLCFLQKSDLKGGTVTYRRHKTGQLLTIAWTKEMQEILDKYPENRSKYLLPIITNPDISEKWTYKNMGYAINCNLKKIGAMVDAPDSQKWSMYYARHTWASLARANGVPMSVISEAMGHGDERTTHIYLASLESSVVDKANDLVINLLG